MTEIRIATFNLESLDEPPRSDHSLADRTAALRPVLERLNADVLCLQEVNGQHIKGERERVLHALKELLQGTRYASYQIASTHRHLGLGHRDPDKGVLDVHNLVTASRFPITASTEIHHDYVPPAIHQLVALPGSDLRTITFERPVLLTEINIGEPTPLSVINVHFRAPLAASIPGQKEAPFVWSSIGGWAEGYYLAAQKRTGQALETRLLTEKIFDKAPEAPIIVAGDFNADDYETPLKIVTGAEEDTGNPRLKPRELAVLDREIPKERRYSLRHNGRLLMLDHILASEAMRQRLTSIEVLNEDLKDEVTSSSQTTGSFHAPLIATFKV